MSRPSANVMHSAVSLSVTALSRRARTHTRTHTRMLTISFNWRSLLSQLGYSNSCLVPCLFESWLGHRLFWRAFVILFSLPWKISELVPHLLHDHFHFISLPITYHHAALQTALCRGVQIPLARSPRRLNFVRWRLIFVGLLHGTLLAPRILKWLLDFSKVCGILAQCINHK